MAPCARPPLPPTPPAAVLPLAPVAFMKIFVTLAGTVYVCGLPVVAKVIELLKLGTAITSVDFCDSVDPAKIDTR